jgi:GNAT superfamily N-acetyltransferase
MDTTALSLKMKRLVRWLDDRCQPDNFVRRQFDGPPFGQCYVTIDPERQGKVASVNLNRVYLCGTEAGLDVDGFARLIELFTASGIKKFFVWLSPGPDMEMVRGWLEAGGFSRIRHVSYPTLLRTGAEPFQFKTDLAVREVRPDEIEAARDQLGETLWPDYRRSAGKDGFTHYMAFDGKCPVAIAALAVFEGLGYLTAAATAEADRRRGAQQALIARRIERAGLSGCSILVSETLSILEHSLRNLQRAGFRQAYEKEVYQWTG